MAYLLLGNYLKNGIDISALWLDTNSFELMYAQQINQSTNLQTLKYAAWSLYIFTSRCFRPGTESLQLMFSVQSTVKLLTDILGLQACQDEQLIELVFLGLANVLHMHPPTDLTM